MFYKDKTVYDEALDRIRFLYDNHEDIIVSMSGLDIAQNPRGVSKRQNSVKGS